MFDFEAVAKKTEAKKDGNTHLNQRCALCNALFFKFALKINVLEISVSEIISTDSLLLCLLMPYTSVK